MGPKAKKGGKKSGRKKGKGDSSLSFREVILAYQITTKEQEVAELKFEIQKMVQRNENLAVRNEFLLDEQASLAAQCIDKSRDWRSSTDKPESLGHDAVIATLLKMWKQRDQEEKAVFEIHESILSVHAEEDQLQVDVNEWKEYLNYGKAAQDSYIALLNQEKEDGIKQLEDKKEFLSQDLEKTKDIVHKSADQRVESEKVKAAEKAMNVLQLGGRVELEDSKFLRSELKLHQEEHSRLQQEINTLENRNLEILSTLFDCKVEDIRFSKSIFKSLFKENELFDDDDNIILQTDTDQLHCFPDESSTSDENSEYLSVGSSGDELPEVIDTDESITATFRPVSAKMRDVQKKLENAAANSLYHNKVPQEIIHGNSLITETKPEYGQEDPYLDYVMVAPIEERLLAIAGKKLALIKRSKAELEALGINAENAESQGFFHWPENFNGGKLASVNAPAFENEQLRLETSFSTKLKNSPSDLAPSQMSKKQFESRNRLQSSMLATPAPLSITSRSATPTQSSDGKIE